MATVGLFLGASAATAATVGTVAVIGGVATAGSLIASRKSRKLQEKAMRAQQRASQLQASRSAVQSIRQSQIARADIIQQGENQGVGGSSAVAGGAGSVASQGGANVAFAQKIFGLQNAASRLMQSANMWRGRASGIAQIGNFGMQLAGAGAFTPTKDTSGLA
jgi:hypothetical protein